MYVYRLARKCRRRTRISKSMARMGTFVSDRWIKGKDEKPEQYALRLGLMNRCDLGSKIGSRFCIGKNIAKLEIYNP